MKKTFKFFGVIFMTLLVSLNIVDAKDLTAKMESSSVLGDSINYDYYYDEDADINEVLVSILVDESSIKNVLDQTSSSGSELSIFYLTFNSKMEGETFKKLGVWAGGGLRTFDEAKSKLDADLSKEAAVNYSDIYVNALSVEYYNGTAWVKSDTEGNGSTSIRDDLVAKLGLTDASELEYGENFRFSMYDEYSYLWGIEAFDAAGESLGVEYFRFDWKIEFPVSGKLNDSQVLFTSVNEAIEAGSKDITVNKNTTVTEDLVIPSDVSVYVGSGVTLKIADDVDFEVEGAILGTVEIDGEEVRYSLITVEDSKNGTVLSNKEFAATGEEVTLEVKADDKYELDSLKVFDLDDKEVEVKDGKFIMPDKEVYVVATFKEANAVVNPNTSDNVVMFVIFGLVGLTVSVIGTKKFKKAMN